MKLLLVLLMGLISWSSGSPLKMCKSKDGVLRKHNEEWKMRNFMIKCIVTDKMWKTEPVACLTNTGKRVDVGATLTEGEWTYKCENDPNGKYVQLNATGPSSSQKHAQVPTTCMIQGTERKHNEEFKYGNFWMKCVVGDKRWETELLACFTHSGQKINPGANVTEAGKIYSCIRKENGGLRLKFTPIAGEKQQTCIDASGVERKHNEEFTEGNFKMKCNVGDTMWKTEVIGCLTKSGQLIDVGAAKTEGSLTYKCEKLVNGSIKLDISSGGGDGIAFSQDAVCQDKGKVRQNNEEYTDGHFVIKCTVDDKNSHKTPVACLTDNAKRVEIGSSVVEGSDTFNCQKKEGGGLKLNVTSATDSSQASGSAQCKVSGVERKVGDEWNDGEFVLKCITEEKKWKANVVACLTKNGQRINLGSSLVEGDLTYKCEQISTDQVKLSKCRTTEAKEEKKSYSS